MDDNRILEAEEGVVCRPEVSFTALAAMSSGIGIACSILLANNPTIRPLDQLLYQITAACFWLPGIIALYWSLRARVVASSVNGIRWRGFGRWWWANWSQVTDYYATLSANSDSKPASVLEIAGKSVRLHHAYWRSIPALREIVQQQTEYAKTREWAVRGMRPSLDWPMTFEYATNEARTMYVIARYLIPASIGAFVVFNVNYFFTAMSGAFSWLSIGRVTFMAAVYCILGVVGARPWIETRRRFGEQITIDQVGIRYHGALRNVNIAWDEITGLTTMTGNGVGLLTRYRVAAKTNSFDFLSTISNARLLIRLIPVHTTDPAAKLWVNGASDAVAAASERWSGGREGVGRRVFRYRSRLTRAMMCFFTAMVAMPWVGVLVNRWLAVGPSVSITVLVTWTACLGAVCAWSWWRYFVASVQIDDDCITQYDLSGPTCLTWQHVERFYLTGSQEFTFVNVIGNGKKIRFSTMISDVAELKREIRRRATNSETADWNDVDTEV